MWKCPKSEEHKRFSGTAHVTQDWQINENGDFVSTIAECVEVLHKPSCDDVVTCVTCGTQAEYVG